MSDPTNTAAYVPREVAHDLRQAARQQYGPETTTDEDLDGSTLGHKLHLPGAIQFYLCQWLGREEMRDDE